MTKGHLLRATARRAVDPAEWDAKGLNPIVPEVQDASGKPLTDEEAFNKTENAVTEFLQNLKNELLKGSDPSEDRVQKVLAEVAETYKVPEDFIKTRLGNLFARK